MSSPDSSAKSGLQTPPHLHGRRENTARRRTDHALIAGHPGHELRIFRWLEVHKPLAFVLTDGSGHGESDRLESTRRVLEDVGCETSSVLGPWSDREAYRIILEGDLEAVQEIVIRIVAQLVERRVRVVASDAVEGFNPVHDLCYVIAESCREIASRRLGYELQHFDFPLAGSPDTGGLAENGALRIELGAEELTRKLAAARGYAELRREVEGAVESHTAEAFGVEVLAPAAPRRDLVALAAGAGGTGSEPEVPEGRAAYEVFGEKRVAQGVYPQVLRLGEHWLPLADALRRWARRA